MLDPAPKTILIVNIRLIGDTILTTPLIDLLKQAYPEAAIDFLVNRGTGEFLDRDPRVRNILYSEKGDFGNKRRAGGYLWKILGKYELAVNLNTSDRGNLAVLLAGRRWRVGFCQKTGFLKNFWKKLLFTHVIEYPFSMHVARLNQLIARALGLEVSRLEAKVFWNAGDAEAVATLLKNRGVSGRYFVIHPFARWRYKYWSVERFAALSDSIAREYGLQPVWTSSPDPEEKRLLREGAVLCRHRPVCVEGELNLNRITCLIDGASLYVGLDTAVSHLAATTGVPMVALYGPTIAERWSPWDNDGPVAQQCPEPRGTQRVGNITLIQKGWECVPCGRSGCDNSGMESPCMQEIETGEVLQAINLLLQGEQRVSPPAAAGKMETDGHA